MPETEQWRPIPGFPGYEISDTGRILSRRRKHPLELRQNHDTGGYRQVRLMRDGVPLTCRVHVLVAATFIGPRPDGLETRHFDGDKENCRASNLLYGTRSENTFDQVRHGTHVQASKAECVNGHEFTEQNTRVTADRRYCRACDRDKTRRYRIRRALRTAGISSSAVAA